MTTNEIDAHPDADRIWATIVAIRADAESVAEEENEDREGAVEDAIDGARTECARGLIKMLDDLPRGATFDDLERAARKLAGCWK